MDIWSFVKVTAEREITPRLFPSVVAGDGARILGERPNDLSPLRNSAASLLHPRSRARACYTKYRPCSCHTHNEDIFYRL